jgi:hypothetical protein
MSEESGWERERRLLREAEAKAIEAGNKLAAAVDNDLTPVRDYGRSKYLRLIYPADGKGEPIYVDVYSVLKAFKVECHARGHCVKKLLCTGIRGKGDAEQDLREAAVALDRSITQALEK